MEWGASAARLEELVVGRFSEKCYVLGGRVGKC